MVFDPSTAKEEVKPKFDPSTAKLENVPVPVPSVELRQAQARKEAGIPEPKPDRSRKDIGLGELGISTAGGAVGGAFLPEILSAGGRAAQSTGLPYLSTLGRLANCSSVSTIKYITFIYNLY